MKIELEVGNRRYGVAYGDCGEKCYDSVQFFSKKKDALKLFNTSKKKISEGDFYKDFFVDLLQNGKCISTYSRGL